MRAEALGLPLFRGDTDASITALLKLQQGVTGLRIFRGSDGKNR